MDLLGPVQRGVELLDGHGLDGWRSKIDWLNLDMNSHEMCILGQLYGSFGDGIAALRLTLLEKGDKNRYDASFFGFELPDGWWHDDMFSVAQLCDRQTAMWRLVAGVA